MRQWAEKLLKIEIAPVELSPEDAARLLHELLVHQMELELQHEELQQAQVRLQESRDRYSELYDFSPTGYLTLDERGHITEANLTVAIMLGEEKRHLVGRFFPYYLEESEQRGFLQWLGDGFNLRKKQGEFHLLNNKGEVITVLLDIHFFRDAEGMEHRYLSLTDITKRQQAKEALGQTEVRLGLKFGNDVIRIWHRSCNQKNH